VSSFHLERDGTVTARFETSEIALIAELSTQLTELLTNRSDDDPALQRLLPDAYPDDAEASAEFRRFTADGLVERKLANASALLGSIGGATATGTASTSTSASGGVATLRLDPRTAQAWLRSIGDLRLTIATRLGIEQDGDEGDPDNPMTDLYDWLGYLQGSLVDVLDGPGTGDAA
jgi:hypothetical protein